VALGWPVAPSTIRGWSRWPWRLASASIPRARPRVLGRPPRRLANVPRHPGRSARPSRRARSRPGPPRRQASRPRGERRAVHWPGAPPVARVSQGRWGPSGPWHRRTCRHRRTGYARLGRSRRRRVRLSCTPQHAAPQRGHTRARAGRARGHARALGPRTWCMTWHSGHARSASGPWNSTRTGASCWRTVNPAVCADACACPCAALRP